jgi:hypothetical protein
LRADTEGISLHSVVRCRALASDVDIHACDAGARRRKSAPNLEANVCGTCANAPPRSIQTFKE